jgi:hypothetical protein
MKHLTSEVKQQHLRSVRVVFLFVFGQLYPSTLDYYSTLIARRLPSVVGLAPVSDRKSLNYYGSIYRILGLRRV